MNEEIEVAITAICVCGAGVTLQPAGDGLYEGKCPLCSREYSGAAGPFTEKGE